MPDPFRDELTAARTRADELQSENDDLRVRVAALETEAKSGSSEAREISELHAKLREEQRAHRQALEALQAQNDKALSPRGLDTSTPYIILAGLFGFALGYMLHC